MKETSNENAKAVRVKHIGHGHAGRYGGLSETFRIPDSKWNGTSDRRSSITSYHRAGGCTKPTSHQVNVMQDQKFCPGVTEVRQITAKMYGVRVSRHLVPKLKKITELQRANSKSDLFCFELTNMMNKSTDAALGRFKEIVAKAGLGQYFGSDDGSNL